MLVTTYIHPVKFGWQRPKIGRFGLILIMPLFALLLAASSIEVFAA